MLFRTPRDPHGHPGVGIRPSWEPYAIAAFLVFAVFFGYMTVKRSAFSERRMTDAGVFFRAGWAVREGVDPMSISDENGWRYIYPPAIAATFVPLADAPIAEPLPSRAIDAREHRTSGYLPYWVSVAIWYAFSVLCAVVSIELLARTLTRGSPDPHIRLLSPASGGWWNIRFWPLLCLAPDFGSTLSKGQINLQMLVLICGGIYLLAEAARRAHEPVTKRARLGPAFWAGVCLAAAACIKVIPGILVFDVLTRRGWRTIFGYGACGVFVMIIAPVLIFGPTKAYEYTWTFTDKVLLAGLSGSEERLQHGAGFENTDNLAIQGVLHNLMHMATPRGERPAEPAPWVKPAHLAISAGLLIATLLIGRARRDDALAITLRIGMLCAVMLAATPMCHRHYYVFMLPAVFALVFMNIGKSPLGFLHGWGLLLIPLYPTLMGVARVWSEGLLRDLPIPLVLNLTVWSLAAIALHQHSIRGSGASPGTNDHK